MLLLRRRKERSDDMNKSKVEWGEHWSEVARGNTEETVFWVDMISCTYYYKKPSIFSVFSIYYMFLISYWLTVNFWLWSRFGGFCAWWEHFPLLEYIAFNLPRIKMILPQHEGPWFLRWSGARSNPIKKGYCCGDVISETCVRTKKNIFKFQNAWNGASVHWPSKPRLTRLHWK